MLTVLVNGVGSNEISDRARSAGICVGGKRYRMEGRYGGSWYMTRDIPRVRMVNLGWRIGMDGFDCKRIRLLRWIECSPVTRVWGRERCSGFE